VDARDAVEQSTLSLETESAGQREPEARDRIETENSFRADNALFKSLTRERTMVTV
jgi:hypothetical protein